MPGLTCYYQRFEKRVTVLKSLDMSVWRWCVLEYCVKVLVKDTGNYLFVQNTAAATTAILYFCIRISITQNCYRSHIFVSIDYSLNKPFVFVIMLNVGMQSFSSGKTVHDQVLINAKWDNYAKQNT